MPPLVDVAVVTWNTRELTTRLLRRLVNSDQGVPFRVVVHDNASTDGTVAALRQALPEVEVSAGATNLGFAGGVNTVLARCRAPFLFPLNSDACPRPGTLGRLVAAAAAHERVAAVAPRLVRPDGGLEHSTYPFPSLAIAGLYASGLRERLPQRWADRLCLEGSWHHDRPRTVDWAFGAALLIPRSTLDAVGGFDDSLFMYAEDVDWCWRARRHGYRVWFEPGAVVEHVGNASGAQAYGTSRRRHVMVNTQRVYRRYRGAVSAEMFRRLNVRIARRVADQARNRGDLQLADEWWAIASEYRALGRTIPT
ncbi:MAG TPA: glycosyltransferase family 2 protein [Mycobacteriales bacterium]|nr:glycosyltransferase family 2 protein [Mycobacteriales bacterium]